MGCLNDGSNTVLNLGLALESNNSSNTNNKPKLVHKPCLKFEPSLSLGLCGGDMHGSSYGNNKKLMMTTTEVKKVSEVCCDVLHRQASPPHSQTTTAVSNSFSSGRVKRERDVSTDEIDVERVLSCSRISDEDYELDASNNPTRKKLRLSKEQSALLEESFKQHSTLNPKQKQALARQLNLRPRQVEVWFQNRRARTKLKQTEADCEVLKKCCETLTDENRRLQREVQELKALKMAQPFYMQMPAATLTMCPSCERIGGVNDASAKNNPFSMAPKPAHHFYNPFTNPSAAC